MPNMIIPNKIVMYGAIHVNPDGAKKAIAANKSTQIANVFPTNWLIRSKVFIVTKPFTVFNILL